MSVIKSKRNESAIEFIHTARALELHTIKKAVGFPKRYTFYISQPLVKLAQDVHQLVKMGNSIYPKNQHEVQIRRDYFLRALASLQAFISQLEVAAELFPIEPNQMKFWMDMVNREDRLIRAVLKKEAERYKNLPAI